jgi:hypothetical protein
MTVGIGDETAVIEIEAEIGLGAETGTIRTEMWMIETEIEI